MNLRSVLQVSSRPVTVSCSAKGGEKELRVKLTIGRKAEGSPLERLMKKQKKNGARVRKLQVRKGGISFV